MSKYEYLSKGIDDYFLMYSSGNVKCIAYYNIVNSIFTWSSYGKNRMCCPTKWFYWQSKGDGNIFFYIGRAKDELPK